MSKFLQGALKLHNFLYQQFWDGEKLLGPDCGVRFNRILWRFGKSYLDFVPWNDNYCYLQAQGYWVLCNWQLYTITGENQYADLAIQCANGILKDQSPEGYWVYPHPGWKGRIGTVEGVFAALGMLATYERTGKTDLLIGIQKWHDYLIRNTGFQKTDAGLAINYFSNKPVGLVPNNSTHALAFFGRMAAIMGDNSYIQYCPALIAFLASVQMETGELPYSLKGEQGDGRDRIHFQCYQYHAFQLQHLAMYYDAVQDDSVLPIIRKIAQFIAGSVREDGSTKFDCLGSSVRVIYHTAAVASALGIARRMGLHDAIELENRAYDYVLSHQHENGGFPYSSREYGFLNDQRYYPRTLSMILYHLLLKAGECSVES